MSSALTESIDVAQVVLYAFWAFFFGLIFWLRREDRREGYPLESDNPRRVGNEGVLMMATPKTFLLPHGGEYTAPNFERDTREFPIERTAASAGSPLQPLGDPMLAGVGPGAWALRSDTPERMRGGKELIVPLRVATDFAMDAGPDPRGWNVVAADGEVAGVVKDLWVDRADVMVRYLEVELPAAPGAAPGAVGARRLLPITMLRLRSGPQQVQVNAVRAVHFASVPTLKNPDSVTLLEEEKIGAFYAGGRLYAEPKRLGPIL